MRDTIWSVRRQPTGRDAAGILDAARTGAVAVAESAMDVFASGRWDQTLRGQQAYQLATAALVLEAEMGAVCEAEFAERHIRVMAETAHLLVQHARDEAEEGSVHLSRICDSWLVDPAVDAMLVPAYAIVVTSR